nr:MAG TPA: hypothetical protein [Caudoviricetes sp.]
MCTPIGKHSRSSRERGLRLLKCLKPVQKEGYLRR